MHRKVSLIDVYLHVLQTQTDQFEEFRDLILQRTPIDRYTYNIM